MSKISIFGSAIILSLWIAEAQQITPATLASGETRASQTGLSVSATLGEAIGGTIANSDIQVTLGFQQYESSYEGPVQIRLMSPSSPNQLSALLHSNHAILVHSYHGRLIASIPAAQSIRSLRFALQQLPRGLWILSTQKDSKTITIPYTHQSHSID